MQSEGSSYKVAILKFGEADRSSPASKWEPEWKGF